MSTRYARFVGSTTMWGFLVATMLVLTACGGGGGGVGADSPPPAAVTAFVPQSGSNQQNVINPSNQSDFWVRVEVGPESSSEDTITVSIGDGNTGPSVSAQAPAPQGQGGLKLGPINARDLPDGSHPLIVEITNAAGSSGPVVMGTVLKDTTFYTTAVSSFITAFPAGNQANGTAMENVINLVNLGNTTVATVWGPDADETLTFVVEITDERGNVAFSPTFSGPEGAGAFNVQGIDASNLEDGPVTVTVRVTDGGGNETAFPGAAGMKDTVVSTPVAAYVPAGAENPADYINASSQAAVMTRAILSGSFGPEETITVELSDGVNTVTSESQTVAVPEGPNDFSFDFPTLDCSTFSEGLASLTAYVEDDHGNRTTFSGQHPVKDTVIGQVIATLVAQGQSNAPGIINIASETQVYLNVTCDGQTAAGDFVTAHFETSGLQAQSAPVSVSGPGTAMIGPADTSLLYDGNVTVRATMTDAAGNSWNGATSVADKGTVAPSTPAYVRIASGPSNAQDIINGYNASSVTVETMTGAGDDPSRTVTFTATNGSVTLTQTLPATTGNTAIAFNGVDFSEMGDGPFQLTCWATDGFANRSESPSANATKDTFGPASPANIYVRNSGSNPQGFISAANVTATQFVVNHGALDLGVAWQLIVTDQFGGNVSSSTMHSEGNPTDIGPTTITLNTSSLADGPISMTYNAADPAGNTVSYASWTATKDVLPAGPPSTLIVQSGPTNGNNVINMHNEVSTHVKAVFGSGTLGGGELFTVTVTPQGSSSPAVSYGPVSGAAIGGSTFSFGPLNTTAIPEGNVSVRIDIVDAAGNAASYNGSTAIKDVTPPAMPSSAAIPAGASNPANFINTATESSVTVDAVFGAGSDSSDQVTLTLQGPAFSISTPTTSAPAGAGPMSFTGINTSTMFDGSVAITMTLEDAYQNTTSFTGTAAIKDTVAAATPINAAVAAGPNNPQGYINGASMSATSVAVEFPDPFEDNGTWRAILTDTVAGSVSAAWNPTSATGGNSSVSVDTSSLMDGTITISVEVTDEAGNTSVHASWSAIKDSVATGAPTSLTIAADTNNAVNVVNQHNEGNAMVRAAFANGVLEGGELFTVTLTPQGLSSPAVTYGPISGGATGGSVFNFGPMDTALIPEGAMDITLQIEDPAGNAASFLGTVATKDVTPPAAPSSGMIVAGASNPANYINISNEANVNVDVVFGASSDPSDQVTLALQGQAFTISPAQVGAPNGAGTLSFTGIDTTAMFDGTVAVSVTVEDTYGNESTFTGTPAEKDTVAPGAPSAAGIAAGNGNTAGFINQSNETSVFVQVEFPNGALSGGELFTVEMTPQGSGSPLVTYGPISGGAIGGSTFTFGPMDSTPIPEGGVDVNVMVEDSAGNITSFAGAIGTKDVTAPAAPTAAFVPSGTSNPINVINMHNEGSVDVDVSFGATSVDTDQVTVTLQGSSFTATSSPATAPNGSGTITLAGINAAAFFDGPVAITATVQDTSGNQITFSGTAATKDTVAPPAPIIAAVPAGGSNPVNTVNIATAGAFSVDVTWDSSADASAAAVVTVEDGSNPVVSGSIAPNPSSTVSYGGLDGTLLAEGNHVIRVDVTDANMNVTTFTGTAVLKDSIAPGNPDSLQVQSGASNAANVINESNENSTFAQATFLSGVLVGDELFTVTITPQGLTSPAVTFGPVSGGAAGSSTFNFGAMDTTVIPEGNVDVALQIEDQAGNVTTFAGAAAFKDVTAPSDPTSAQVIAGASNAADIINITNESSVSVDVAFGASSDSADQVTVTLQGAAFSVSSGPVAASAGAGTVNFTGMNTSVIFDGNVAVSVTIDDAYGNQTIYAGTTAWKDTVAPTIPTFAGIAATANNPVNWVNMASQGQVEVLMTFPSTSEATDIVTLTIADSGSGSMSYGPTNATDGAGNLAFVNQDFSGLVDGALNVTVDIADQAGNTATSSGTSATKDTVPPTAPVSWSIVAGANNSANVVNSLSINSVEMSVDYNGAPVGDESVNFNVTSSGGGTFQMTTNPNVGDGVRSYAGNDFGAVGMQDGNLTLSGDISDPAGNLVTFAGTPAIQDTASPADPDNAFVAGSGSNPINVINAASANAADVTVTFSTFDVADQVTVTLQDTVGTSVTAGPISSAAGVGFTGIDTTGLIEGTVTVEVSVSDANGNPASVFNGTAAIKDITAPDAVTSANVLASGMGNNADWVSADSQGSVDIRVVLPSSYDATDLIDFSVDDNVSTVSAAQQNTPASGGDVDYTGMDFTGLVDGQLDINVTTTDQYGNAQTQVFSADKDVVLPSDVTGAIVIAGTTNPQDFINVGSQTGVVVDISYGPSADVNDRAAVTMSDTFIDASSAAVSANANGTVSTAPFDVSALADGPISMAVNLFDLAGNTAKVGGSGSTKDTIAPHPAVVDPVPSPVNASSQDVTGVAEPNHTVDIIMGGTVVATGTSDSLGSFIVNWTIPTDATTRFEVRSVDPAGNPQAADTEFDWNNNGLQFIHDSAGPDVPWTDNTVSANLGYTGSVSGGSFIDVDNDGDLDLFVNETGRLWQNDGDGVYTDITASMGVTFTGNESAVWADYDNDGDMDLWTTHSTLGSFLWENQLIPSGTVSFTDVSSPSGAAVGGTLRGAAWFDYNADGWADLVSADADGLGNELLRNDGATGFTSIFGSGLDPIISAPRWVCVGDLDGNGGIDLVIGDAAPSLQYMNTNGTFADVAGTGLGQSGFSADTSSSNGGIAMADLDNDGDLDMFVASGGAGGTNQFWQNDGAGNFVDVAVTAGCDTAVNAYDVVIADFDNDGFQDIYLACNGSNVLLRNQGDQLLGDGIPEFTDVAGQTGGAVNDGNDGRLACAGDVDGDGDMDVFVGNESTPNVMYENGLGNNYRWMKVKLIGKGGALAGSSSDAIGAKVRIEDASTGGDLCWRWVNGGRGAGADDPKTLHFGGLAPSRAYHVHITWPNGTTQSAMNVVPAMKPGQTLTVVEQ